MSDAGESPPVSPGFLLWHATLRWQRLIAAALRPLELTHVQFVLLAVLWWFTEVRGERPTQRALADQAGTDRMMTSQVLRALEGRGLLERPQHPTRADASGARGPRARAAGAAQRHGRLISGGVSVMPITGTTRPHAFGGLSRSQTPPSFS